MGPTDVCWINIMDTLTNLFSVWGARLPKVLQKEVSLIVSDHLTPTWSHSLLIREGKLELDFLDTILPIQDLELHSYNSLFVTRLHPMIAENDCPALIDPLHNK